MEHNKTTTTNNQQVPSTELENQKEVQHSYSYKAMVPLIVSIIAILLALTIFIYSVYLIQNKTASGSHVFSDLSENINNQSHQIADLSNQLSAIKTTITNNNTQITDNQKSIQNLQEIKIATDLHWKLTEIKYLLTIADYNLRLEKTPTVALVILEKVNNELNALNDPAALPLRQSIVTALTQLKAVPVIDIAGTLMQLKAIEHQLNQLPLISPATTSTTKTAAADAVNHEVGWRKYWHQSLESLTKLIIIRHQNQPIEPLITPKEQYFLEENIQLKLSEASWGLLQSNQAVYQQSLQDSLDWIQKYYAVNSPVTSSVITALQNLLKLNVQETLPDLTVALTQINKLLKTAPSAKGAKP